MVWLVQNCRSNKCLSVILQTPRASRGLRPHGPPTRDLPSTRWGPKSGPQTLRLLTPPLTTNPGSAPVNYLGNNETLYISYAKMSLLKI